MRILIVGYGSIGQRHARILRQMIAGIDIAIVSTRVIGLDNCYYDLADALFHHRPDYVIVSTRTSEHYRTLSVLVRTGFSGKVLIEKPLFDIVREMPQHAFSFAAVAYNLRFHPLVIELKHIIKNSKRIYNAAVYVGSYLPNWRLTTDYRISYSAMKNQGGGVLRDLSHELDIVYSLFGSWKNLAAKGGHLSNLEIDSDDVFSILMETHQCPVVSVNMNYLDRMPRREIIINTDAATIRVDLNNSIIEKNGIAKTMNFSIDETYMAEHKAMLENDHTHLCSIADAVETLTTIEAAETAALSQTWISK